MWNCRMWKVKCGMTVIGLHVRPYDRSYYTAYCNMRVAGKVVNCVLWMWKVGFCVYYFNLPNVFTWKLSRNYMCTNKSYCCIWRTMRERGADLHMAQLMPLPLTFSCFSKIQIGFTFLVPAPPGSPGERAVKWVCVYVCVCVRAVSIILCH